MDDSVDNFGMLNVNVTSMLMIIPYCTDDFGCSPMLMSDEICAIFKHLQAKKPGSAMFLTHGTLDKSLNRST